MSSLRSARASRSSSRSRARGSCSSRRARAGSDWARERAFARASAASRFSSSAAAALRRRICWNCWSSNSSARHGVAPTGKRARATTVAAARERLADMMAPQGSGRGRPQRHTGPLCSPPVFSGPERASQGSAGNTVAGFAPPGGLCSTVGQLGAGRLGSRDVAAMAGAWTINGNATGNYNYSSVPTNAIKAAVANKVFSQYVQGDPAQITNVGPTDSQGNYYAYTSGQVKVEVGTYAYTYNDANPSAEG